MTTRFTTLARQAQDDAKCLDMQRLVVRVENGLMQHLAQGWMRENRVHQFGFRRLKSLGDRVSMNEFGHFGADHMSAQKLAGFRFEYSLYETLIFAEGNRFAVALEWKAANPHGMASRFGGSLR